MSQTLCIQNQYVLNNCEENNFAISEDWMSEAVFPDLCSRMKVKSQTVVMVYHLHSLIQNPQAVTRTRIVEYNILRVVFYSCLGTYLS